MKKSIKLLLAALVMMTSSKAMAQISEMSQSFNKFVTEIISKDYVTSSSKESYRGGAYYNSYDFTIPDNETKAMEQFKKTLVKNSIEAYNVFTKKAQSNNNDSKSIVYGNGNEKSFSFGKNKDRNYQLIWLRDRRDSTMRAVYALVWYKEKGKSSVSGTVCSFYGKDPALDSNKTSIGIRNNMFNTTPKDSYEFMTQFGNLLSAFTDGMLDPVKNKALCVGILNKMSQMAGKYGYMLSPNDVATCKKGLKTMCEYAIDNYQTSLISLIGDNLEKSKKP